MNRCFSAWKVPVDPGEYGYNTVTFLVFRDLRLAAQCVFSILLGSARCSLFCCDNFGHELT